MSHLKLFAPEDAGIDGGWPVRDGEPVILHFPVTSPQSARSEVAPPHFLALAQRAQQLRHNRHCRLCGRATVETVELLDQSFNSRARPVPGTATVAGFHCRACDFEWTA